MISENCIHLALSSPIIGVLKEMLLILEELQSELQVNMVLKRIIKLSPPHYFLRRIISIHNL